MNKNYVVEKQKYMVLSILVLALCDLIHVFLNYLLFEISAGISVFSRFLFFPTLRKFLSVWSLLFSLI